MHRVLTAFLAAASCASIAQAQTAISSSSTEPVLTLDQALALADAGSPTTDLASAGVRVAEAGRSVARLRPNPAISIETENFVGSGDYRGLRSAETTTAISLPIELGGKRPARIALADARIVRAHIQAAVALADLRLRVAEAYIEAAAAERRVGVARQQAVVAAEELWVASVRVKAGAASPIERRRADVQRINADLALERARRGLDVARGNLARLIGQPVSDALDLVWFERVSDYGPAKPIATTGTLALAVARADVQTAQAGVRLARTQRGPDLTVSAGARRLEATSDVAAVIGVSLPIPLFNKGRTAVAQATAELDQTQAQTRVAVIEAEQAIAAAQADLANAAASARAAGGPALAAASEAARIARIGYAQGKFSQLDLLEAERTLAETRVAFTDALASHHLAEARLGRLTAPAPAPILSGTDR